MVSIHQSIPIKEINVFKRHSTSSLFEAFLPTAIQIDRFTTLTLFSLGIIGNIISIIVWWFPRLRIRESAVLSFIFLSGVDLIYLLLTMVEDLDRVWSVNLFYNDGFCKMFKVLRTAFGFYSMLIMLTICIQHILSIKNQDTYEYYKSKKWTYLIVLLLGVVSILFSIAEGVFSSIENENIYSHECSLPKDILMTSQSYKVYYWLVRFFLTSTIVVSISSLCIYILHNSNDNFENNEYFHRNDCNLNEDGYCSCPNNSNNDKNNISLTKTIIIVGFYSVFITIPLLILVSLEPLNSHGDVRMSDFEVLEDPIWERYFNIEGAKIIFNELYLSKFSIKIFIYFLCNKSFRQCFLEIFGFRKFVERFYQSHQKLRKRKIKKRTNLKPISYYIDRTKNTYPFPPDKRLPTNPRKNLNKALIDRPRSLKVSNIQRAPKPQTIERSNIYRKKDFVMEPVYYSVPRSKPRLPRHIHRCNRIHANNKNLQNVVEAKEQNIVKIKEHHNVCSEIKYLGNSSSSSTEESPILYLKNCQCKDGKISNTSSDNVLIQYNNNKVKKHQV